MKSHYTFRLQIAPEHDPDDAARQLLELADKAGMDEMMVQFYADEMNDGHETLDGVRRWVEHSRPYRQALRAAGVAVTFNPWHSLMHCDRHPALKPGQNWQTMVDPTGWQSKAVVCPLDEAWQTYFAQVLAIFTDEDPGVYWIDDDIRLHNHGQPQWGGCFCPLHIAEFNRRTGLNASREEIVANCTAAGAPHPWREQWLDMWDDTMLELIGGWRTIAEAGGSRLGLMSSSLEFHSAEGRRWAKWWQALSGDKPPIHRPNFWNYADVLGQGIINSIAKLDENRSVQPEAVESGPEIETTVGQWNRSDCQIHAQMALAQILGSTSLNISPYTYVGDNFFDEPARNERLKNWKPVCDWLADEFPMSMRSHGVGVLWSPDIARQIHTDGSGRWDSLICAHRGWAWWLGAAGHAFQMRPSASINALSGKSVWAFDDDQLRGWLSKGLIIDAVAAQVIIERGFGSLIGVGGYEIVDRLAAGYTFELFTDPDFRLHQDAGVSVFRWKCDDRLFRGQLNPGARVISEVVNFKKEKVGHGTVLFENALGGRIALSPWDINLDLNMTVARQFQLTQVLRYLDPNSEHGYASGNAWLVPQFLTDGKQWRGVIWNAAPDEVDQLQLFAPAGMNVRRAEQVTTRAERVPLKLDGDMLRFARPLRQWEFVVLSDK